MVKTCKVKAIPTHTSYLFGSIKEIAGKKLHIIEQNKRGDCLCLNVERNNLVDVDFKDIESVE